MSKLEAWLERSKETNKEYCEPNSLVDSGNIFYISTSAIAVIEAWKKEWDMMEAGYAGMFGSDNVLTKDDAFIITEKIVERALAIDPEKL